jgi:hypothetical protein
MTTLTQALEVQQVAAMKAKHAVRSQSVCFQGEGHPRASHPTGRFGGHGRRSWQPDSHRPGFSSVNNDSNPNGVHGRWVLRFGQAAGGTGDTDEPWLQRTLVDLSGDRTTTLLYCSEEGVVLRGTKAGFVALAALLKQGQLFLVLGIHVLGVEWIPDDPASMEDSKGRPTSYGDVFSQTLPQRPSKPYRPPSIIAIYSNPDQPTKFGWTIGHGSEVVPADEAPQMEHRLIEYFSTAVAFKDADFWVNLSPFEPHRILPDGLRNTRLGRDFILQDFELKKYVASLVNPSHPLGRDYWMAVSDRGFEASQLLTRTIRLFQKVWVTPSHISSYQGKATLEFGEAFKRNVEDGDDMIVLTSMDLYVRCVADDLALQKSWQKHHPGQPLPPTVQKLNEDCLEVFEDMILPEVSRELNEGRRFIPMRQMMGAWTMASFFKTVFGDRSGYSEYINTEDPRKMLETRLRCSEGLLEFDRLQEAQPLETPESLYQDYLQLFENGGHRLVSGQFDEDHTPLVMKTYFSGGISVL